MKAIAFALVFLIVSSSFASHMRVSNVLVQIQNLLQTKGPATAVYDLLDGIAQQVHDEQAQHDALHATHVEQCDDEISFRNSEIATAQDALERSQAQEARCEASGAKASTDLDTNLQRQDNVRQTLADNEQRRENEAAAFAQRSEERDEADEAIDEGLALLDQLVTGEATLLQVARHSALLLKKAIHLRQTKSFAPAITALAQVATEYVDPSVAERVRELINNVRDQIESAFAAYQAAESNAIAIYEDTKSHLEGQLEDLQAEEQILRGQIADMALCVTQEEAVQQEAQAKITRNTQLLNDATNLCQTYFEQYETATEGRNDELKVIAELRAMVAARFAQFGSEVAGRADEESSSFTAYTDESVYVGASYEKHGGSYDEAGAEQVSFQRDESLEKLL